MSANHIELNLDKTELPCLPVNDCYLLDLSIETPVFYQDSYTIMFEYVDQTYGV